MRVRARDGGLVLDLELRATKPLVAHGERGLSPKSDEPGNASYYLGYTRMTARGRVGTDGTGTAVTGEAWFDHEWSTSALGPQAVGWDWFSLQLDDGRELMLFEIRRTDGSREAASGGTLVARDGSARRLRAADFEVTVLERWRSPAAAPTIPRAGRVRVPSEGLELDVEPLVADQEMRTAFVYWEGAVSVCRHEPRPPARRARLRRADRLRPLDAGCLLALRCSEQRLPAERHRERQGRRPRRSFRPPGSAARPRSAGARTRP